MKTKKTRWILKSNDGQELGHFTSIEAIAEYIGCTPMWVFVQRRKNNNQVKVKEITYQIIDKLD